MSKLTFLNCLKAAIYVFILFVIINTIGFICIKYFGIGWTEEAAWHERTYMPLAYTIIFFSILIFTRNAILILPSIYLFGAIVVILIDELHGIELLSSINVLFSYVIDIGDFLLQKNNLKIPVLEYGLHTVGMSLYQFGILKLGLFLSGIETNK